MKMGESHRLAMLAPAIFERVKKNIVQKFNSKTLLKKGLFQE
jgi:long-subunit acyl-CoA synthetase (AMP-forming)